ncbi:hypothetical protein N7449_008827 [Penicillium cf. viridicatum]|uniref:Uncharacterized protein n=1 Tax=Penicillium cf. viridicatum TaxID=2972119 RepID=A0A9W9M812_9EURO|nr:hypothetical protein N7449_008827 [Penicillium cf. viridicatum]
MKPIGKLLDVCKPVVFYLTSFDILLPTTEVYLLPPRARCNSYCRQNCTAQRKKLVDCINKELVKENADYKLRDDELKKLTEIVDRVVMKEPVKLHITEEQKRILSESGDAVGKRLSADVTNDTMQKIMEQ